MKICCIFNFAPHYRQAIYKLMDEELPCQFYFGSKILSTITKLDYGIFRQTAIELKSIWFFNRAYWMVGSVGLLFKPYKNYILTGEIHCLSNWVLLVSARLLGKKTYVWSHGYYGRETRLQTFIKKIYFTLARGAFLYGNYSRQLMIENKLDANKLHVIYNSLDYEKNIEVRKQLSRTSIYREKFANEFPVLIFIGRLQPVKKLDLLIQLVHQMGKNGKPVNLVIVGTGSEKEKLEAEVNHYGLTNNVWFFGPSYDEQKTGELIYNSELCVSPGNVGLTGIHSLSYGTPVITHSNFSQQMPEFEAIEKGITGDFFEEESLESLQTTVENWLSEHPYKNDELIKACYQRIDEYYNPAFQVQLLKQVLITKKW